MCWLLQNWCLGCCTGAPYCGLASSQPVINRDTITINRALAYLPVSAGLSSASGQRGDRARTHLWRVRSLSTGSVCTVYGHLVLPSPFKRWMLQLFWKTDGQNAFSGLRVNEGLRVGYAMSPRQLLTGTSFPLSGSWIECGGHLRRDICVTTGLDSNQPRPSSIIRRFAC